MAIILFFILFICSSSTSIILSKKILNKIDLNVPFAFLGAIITLCTLTISLSLISSHFSGYGLLLWGAVASSVTPLLFGIILYPKTDENIKTGSMASGAFTMIWIVPVFLFMGVFN